jgi:hypothetical protein
MWHSLTISTLLSTDALRILSRFQQYIAPRAALQATPEDNFTRKTNIKLLPPGLTVNRLRDLLHTI